MNQNLKMEWIKKGVRLEDCNYIGDFIKTITLKNSRYIYIYPNLINIYNDGINQNTKIGGGLYVFIN